MNIPGKGKLDRGLRALSNILILNILIFNILMLNTLIPKYWWKCIFTLYLDNAHICGWGLLRGGYFLYFVTLFDILFVVRAVFFCSFWLVDISFVVGSFLALEIFVLLIGRYIWKFLYFLHFVIGWYLVCGVGGLVLILRGNESDSRQEGGRHPPSMATLVCLSTNNQRNTFCNRNKYCLQLGQIHLAI